MKFRELDHSTKASVRRSTILLSTLSGTAGSIPGANLRLTFVLA